MVARLESIEREIIPDESPDASYLYQDGLGLEDRRAAYERGDFGFIGVRASAEILIPHGDGFVSQTITSPGLWGVEDDSDESYLENVYEEERETLYDMLRELHVAISESSAA